MVIIRVALFAVLLLLLVSLCCGLPSNSYRLADVRGLTFRKGQETAGRRMAPIQQLRCVSGPCETKIKEVKCRNVGAGYNGEVQWKCEAELPKGISFSTINVNCEGYSSADDDYVLRDSCGLEYGLVRSNIQKQSTADYADHNDDAGKDRVLLKEVNSLNFKKGKKTKARRGYGIPQLRCISGPCQISVDSVQCKNVGVDDRGEIQWQCHAELPKGVSFSSVNVNCEGYFNSQDDAVLKGSCGLEYSLKGVPQGKDRYRHTTLPVKFYNFATQFPWLFLLLIFLVSLFVLLKAPNRMLHGPDQHYGLDTLAAHPLGSAIRFLDFRGWFSGRRQFRNRRTGPSEPEAVSPLSADKERRTNPTTTKATATTKQATVPVAVVQQPTRDRDDEKLRYRDRSTADDVKLRYAPRTNQDEM